MATQQGLIDLSDRAVFRLTGADRVRYLNGQVSNDVTRATGEAAIEACVCNLRGKLDGVVFITVEGDGEAFRIDAPGELRDSLFARLDRYIIADDCELADVSDELALVHAVGKPQANPPGAAWRSSNRFGPAGFDLWVERGSLAKVLASGTVLAPDTVEEIRILHGIPKWGAELSEEVLPAEAGLDRRAVDFQKGCYLGQEVVSRIESVGRVNRALALVVGAEPGAIFEAGWEVYPEGEEKAVGRIGSAAYSPELDRRVGLAIVKRDFSEPDSKLVSGPEPDRIAVHLEIRKFKDGGQ